MNQNRRDILKASGVIAAAAVLGATAANASDKKTTKALPTPNGKRVVVVGGGWGGLTAARYIKKLAPQSEVIVLEKRDTFVSCPISNEWITGEVAMDFLIKDYYSASKNFGYSFIQTTVAGIDKNSRSVSTTDGDIEYDYLVLSPGIEYDYSRWFGDNQQLAQRCKQECPPALMSGNEHVALKKMIEDTEEGNFIISIPDGPYRCPPAPYERAALVANYFQKNKIDAKVIILDPKGKPAPQGDGFLAAYRELYPDIIVYKPNTTIESIDLDKKEIKIETTLKDDSTAHEVIKYTAANIIPVNKASRLVAMAGVAGGKAGWGVMNSPTFQSKADERIFVIGDAVGGYPYPKSGAIANGQGHIVAAHIAQLMDGVKEIKESTLPQNICFSMVNEKEAISIGVVFSLLDDKDANGNPIKVIKPKMSENNNRSSDLAKGTHSWYRGMMSDMFGS